MPDLTRRVAPINKVTLNPKKNPYGANAYDMDPRFTLFLQYYIDPKSETFSNALKSGIRAGYSPKYANQITRKKRYKEVMDSSFMIHKAENNMADVLSMKTDLALRDRNGRILTDKDGKPIKLTNAELLRIKVDVSKFIAERLDRVKYGKDEQPGSVTNILNVFDREQSKRIAERILRRDSLSDSSSQGEPGGLRDSNEPQVQPELAS